MGAISGEDAIAIANQYTDESLAGAGAVAGVPCQIQSITDITGGHRVTFLWVDNNGDSHTSSMDVLNGVNGQDGRDGADGKGIKAVTINEEDHLIITYSDDTTSDAGKIEIQSAVDSVNGKTGAVTLDASDVGALPDNTAIPTKTSNLTNDSGFITKAVNDLVNYYLKSETYSKTEVDGIVTAIKNSRFEYVATLPTTDIKTNVIYLVPKSPSQISNVKDEYINLDGTTAGWEKIGDTEIDLSDYVTTQVLNTALANYTTTADLTTLLAAKQDTLTFDNAPTENSNNPVKSGGVYSANQNIYEVMGQNGAKNLLPIKYSKITNYGLIWEKLNDGSVIMNGTSTASPAQQSLFDATPSTITSGSGTLISLKELGIDGTKKYIFSRDTKITNVRPRIDLWSDSAKLTEVELSNNDGLYKEIDFSQYPTCVGIKATIQITLNTTVTNAIQKMMLCSKEWYEVDPTYQPYAETNQQLTADTANKVSWDDLSKVGAVNFLKYPYLDSNKTSSEISITDNGDGTVSFAAGTVSSSGACTFWFERYATGMSAIELRGKTVKFSVDMSEALQYDSTTARIEFSIADSTDTTISGTNNHVPLNNTHNEWIVTVPSNADHFSIMLWIAKNTVLPSFTLSPMITLASYNGDYVPYAKSNKELPGLLTIKETTVSDNSGAYGVIGGGFTSNSDKKIPLTVRWTSSEKPALTHFAWNNTYNSWYIVCENWDGTRFTDKDLTGTLRYLDLT